ncbi:hypothetical protein GJ496_009405 [Pomphorhynchus laevis]|nr:hypothetical protein GJ496_009405 [Pomphorhynchus laevis]
MLEDGDKSSIRDLIESFNSCTTNKWVHSVYHECARSDIEQSAIYASSLLLKKCQHLECKDERGMTPLHISCQNGHIDYARWLLNHDVDIESKDDLGWTALCHCKAAGYDHLATILINEFKANASVLSDKRYLDSIAYPSLKDYDAIALTDMLAIIGVSEKSKTQLSHINKLSQLLRLSYEDLPNEIRIGDRVRISEAVRRFNAHPWSLDSIPQIDEITASAALKTAYIQTKWMHSTILSKGKDLKLTEPLLPTIDDLMNSIVELKTTLEARIEENDQKPPEGNLTFLNRLITKAHSFL